MGPVAPKPRWTAVDWLCGSYALATGVLIAARGEAIERAGLLLAAHAAILLLILALPPRGAAWEQLKTAESTAAFWLREAARFLRHSYPLLLVLYFFEEVRYTVLSVWPAAGYWLEPLLHAADQHLFGVAPAVALSAWLTPWVDELMHFFYFSYYFIIIGGAVLAWAAGYRRNGEAPGPGFSLALTSVVAAFLCAFVWYPWLPARGPWANPELMVALPPFEGFAFQRLIEQIIAVGSIPGGCFPSGHVTGSWGMTFGLWPYHRRTAAVCGILAAGVSIACVYTRIHYAVDVLAGMATALAGVAVARALVRADPPGPLSNSNSGRPLAE